LRLGRFAIGLEASLSLSGMSKLDEKIDALDKKAPRLKAARRRL
jgi:uncharacterized small protein (DUF1192 family)